jgi:hypothetical protein
LDDWTDFEAVLGELTTPLPRRTVRMLCQYPQRGQGAYVIVGTLADLAATASLPLGDKANAAIAIGMAADDHMAAEIHAKHPEAKITRGWSGPQRNRNFETKGCVIEEAMPDFPLEQRSRGL